MGLSFRGLTQPDTDIQPINSKPAINVLAAISVTGGMVSTPTRIKV